VRAAIQVKPLARLRRPKNSEDPRAGGYLGMPSLADVAAVVGLPLSDALRMPHIIVR
jgi:protease IV